MTTRVIVWGLMSTILAIGSVAAESHDEVASEAEVERQHRSLSVIQADLRKALRAEALSRRQGPNPSEVIRLVELYQEMADHPKRDTSLVLKRTGLRLRSRLKEVRDHIERATSRQDRNKNKNPAAANLTAPENRVLAQQVAPGGGAPGAGAQPAAPAGGAVGTIDYGPELVELIQATISPATWDINGGPGAIVYYAPLRVLVVSAPGEVHGGVADVLGQLRAAP
jgi:hypothetical protein